MAYIPMNLSKMISLKYLLLPNEFAPPPEEDFKDAAEAGVNYGKKIENEVHIFDIIRMMPSLRYVEKHQRHRSRSSQSRSSQSRQSTQRKSRSRSKRRPILKGPTKNGKKISDNK